MRERLVAALVGMTIAMIAMYGIPRAYLLADLVTTQENHKVERSADGTPVIEVGTLKQLLVVPPR